MSLIIRSAPLPTSRCMAFSIICPTGPHSLFGPDFTSQTTGFRGIHNLAIVYFNTGICHSNIWETLTLLLRAQSERVFLGYVSKITTTNKPGAFGFSSYWKDDSLYVAINEGH